MRVSLIPKLVQTVALAALCWGAIAPAALAYVDPTAAGSLLQALYLLLASAVVTLGVFPQRVSGWLRRLFGRADAPSSQPGDASRDE